MVFSLSCFSLACNLYFGISSPTSRSNRRNKKKVQGWCEIIGYYDMEKQEWIKERTFIKKLLPRVIDRSFLTHDKNFMLKVLKNKFYKNFWFLDDFLLGIKAYRGAKLVDPPFFGVNQTVFARNSKDLSHLTLSSDREFL